jgi:hypothetical protein
LHIVTMALALVNLTKSIVAQFVHQGIEQSSRTSLIHPVLAPCTIIVLFLDMGIFTSTDSDHPKEFIDIVS